MATKIMNNIVTNISGNFALLALNGMILAAAAKLYTNSTRILEEDFGSNPPSDSYLGYAPSQFHKIIDDMWGVEGCNAYLAGTVMYKALFVLSSSTMMPAILMRMLNKRQWSTSAVPQLGLALLFAQTFETVVECMACLKALDPFPLVVVVAADLCNKVKVVIMSFGILVIVTLLILQSYLWPTILLTGNRNNKKSAKTK
eukprot:CAMPEP_0194251616 /NCGR_PEP_ID=MMETSP0158-20130606/25774_1 /TAXON_ID=33649 /ORGANISM="Thalassionema nitzschioides, Strain L26-B" /LENGTH=199 /DNA_ID=CAMNT_0038988793 /DNA_START=8 /DNA_END=607 /DNA_ORIENTATION=-